MKWPSKILPNLQILLEYKEPIFFPGRSLMGINTKVVQNEKLLDKKTMCVFKLQYTCFRLS